MQDFHASLNEVAAHAARLVSGIETGSPRALRIPDEAREAAQCLEMLRAADRIFRALEFLLDPDERRRARAQAEEGLQAFAGEVARDSNPYGRGSRAPDPLAAERWDAGWLMGSRLETNPPPPGTERVTVQAGQTFRGRTHFEPADYFVTPQFAEHVIECGIARRFDPAHRVLEELLPRWRT